MTAYGYAMGAAEIAEVDATGEEAAEGNAAVVGNEAVEQSVTAVVQSPYGAEEEAETATPHALEAASVRSPEIARRRYFLGAS